MSRNRRALLAVIVSSLALTLAPATDVVPADAMAPAGDVVPRAAGTPKTGGNYLDSRLPPYLRRLGTVICTPRPGQVSLSARTTHGLANHLQQYPDVALATPAQRAAAQRIVELLRERTLRFRDAQLATQAGFDTHLAEHPPAFVGYLHAENRRYSADRSFFDPRRPEALIYANQPGRPLVLVGVMFSMPRGKRGPGSIGPIGRWHSHLVCVRRNKRGLAPVNGVCPRGARLVQGSEMLHMWFTKDLRSAYAVHAPVPELCRDGLLARSTCRSPAARTSM